MRVCLVCDPPLTWLRKLPGEIPRHPPACCAAKRSVWQPLTVTPPAACLPPTGGKDYARGTNFSCMATSGDGYVAVGATDGKLRLYGNKQLTKANTAIPGLGSPITAVDVTFDGRWVVATTDNYLLVVNTIFTSKGAPLAGGYPRVRMLACARSCAMQLPFLQPLL